MRTPRQQVLEGPPPGAREMRVHSLNFWPGSIAWTLVLLLGIGCEGIENDACDPHECAKSFVWNADLCRCDLIAAALPDTLGPMLGSVTDRSARIWMRMPRATDWHVEVEQRGASSVRTVVGDRLEKATDFTGVLDLVDLSADTPYDYRLFLNGAEADSGSFRTLPATGVPSRIRFAVSADLNPAYFDAFDAVREAHPDFLLLIGDQIYADWPDVIPPYPEYYERLHRQVFGEERMQQALHEIPTLMIWDDHEIANDYDRGPSTQRYRAARIAYEEYQDSRNPPPRVPGELYYSFQAGELDFFVLDTRTYRSPRETSDPSTKTMLGSEQFEELLTWLSRSTARLKFIVSSVPFHPWTKSLSDSWSREGFTAERDRLFAFLHEHDIQGVVLLSGDQHWAGVFRLGEIGHPNLYEFQCSPLAVDMQPGPTEKHPDILFVDDVHPGVGLFEVDTTVSPAHIDFRWLDRRGAPQYELSLTELDIQDPGASPVTGPLRHR